MATRLPLLLTCALLSCRADAAELGEPRISSFIGQPLALEIELTALASPATPVQARLARPDVYRGANIGMPPVLSTLTMGVSERDGRQFLRVTSAAPVESTRLHLYLELADGDGRDVRLVTLFIAPNPNPPPPPPAPLLVPASVPAPVSLPAKAPAAVVADLPARPASPKPAKPATPARPVAPAKPAVVAQATPAPAPTPTPTPTPLPLPAPAVTCAPAAAVESATVCTALDVKNAQLREQIGTLEDKVRVLQVALGASPAAVVRDKPAAPLMPRPPAKRPAPQAQASAPWGWIIGAVLAVLAMVAGALFLRRRQWGAPMMQLMLRASPVARLRLWFARKKKAPAPVEPQLDEPSKEMSTQL